MNAGELLDSLHRAGATLEFVDGKPRLRGSKITLELKAALQSNREAVLEEVEKRRRENRDRYGSVPPPDAPMASLSIRLDEPEQTEVRAHVMRQPRPVHAWVMLRGEEYHKRGTPLDECEWRSAVDVIAWQRNTEAAGAVDFVLDMKEASLFKISEQTPNTTNNVTKGHE